MRSVVHRCSRLLSPHKIAANNPFGRDRLYLGCCSLYQEMADDMLTKAQWTVATVLMTAAVVGGMAFWKQNTMRASENDARQAALQAIQPAAHGLIQADQAAQIKRGEYLVNVVARCIDCHTPRTATGELDMTKLLQGAPTWFTPKIKPKGKWDERAQDLTMSGLAKQWGEERLVKFLSTGQKANNPMPAYNLAVDDAKAVVAYLRSLPGKK